MCEHPARNIAKVLLFPSGESRDWGGVPAILRCEAHAKSFDASVMRIGAEPCARDREDLSDASAIAFGKYRAMAGSKDGSEKLANAIDDRSVDDRSEADAHLMKLLLDNISGLRSRTIRPIFLRPARSALGHDVGSGSSRDIIRRGIDVALIMMGNGLTGLVSNDLGFRDKLIAAADANAFDIVYKARALGIPTDLTSIDRVVNLVTRGQADQSTWLEDGGPDIVRINGRLRDALTRVFVYKPV